MDNRLLFHDRIIKTGKGESKFAVRYNFGCLSPFYATVWDMSAKSVSIPLDSVENAGIYAITLETYYRCYGDAPFAFEMFANKPGILHILLEYTDEDVKFGGFFSEICLRQCNIVYFERAGLFKMKLEHDQIISRFLKEKEAAEYNTYF